MQSTLLPIYSIFLIQLLTISVLIPWVHISHCKKRIKIYSAEEFLTATGRSVETEKKRIFKRVLLEVFVVLIGLSAVLLINEFNIVLRIAFHTFLLLSVVQLLPTWLTKSQQFKSKLSPAPNIRSATLNARQLSHFLTLPMTATLIGSYVLTIVVGGYLAYQNLWPRSDATLLLLLTFNTIITSILGMFIYQAVYGKRINFSEDEISRVAKMQKSVNYRSIEIVVLNGFIAALMILVSFDAGLAAVFVSTSIIFQLVMLMSNFRKKVNPGSNLQPG